MARSTRTILDPRGLLCVSLMRHAKSRKHGAENGICACHTKNTLRHHTIVKISLTHLVKSRALWERSSWSNSCCLGNSTARKFLSISVKQYITWHYGSKMNHMIHKTTIAIVNNKPSESVTIKDKRTTSTMFDLPSHKLARKRRAFWAAPELNHLNLQRTTMLERENHAKSF